MTAAVVEPRVYWLTVDDLAVVPEDCPALPFMQAIADDPEAHCWWVHVAAKRQCIDLARAAEDDEFPFVYRPELAREPIRFAHEFCDPQGPYAGQRLNLLPWQSFCVAMLWGWRRRGEESKRRFGYGYVSVPRKNGKTGLVSPLGLYEIACPAVRGTLCEVYSVATALEQAKIVWQGAINLLRTAPAWGPYFRPRVNKLIFGPTNSIWRPLGADKSTLDGLRPELAIMDELHGWKDRGLWDVINSAFGAAHSPLILQITTAGDNPDGICMEQEQRVRAVLDAVVAGTYTGLAEDEANYFGVVWTIDEGDAWDDEAVWHKANPSLGTVKSLEEMRKLAAGARASLGARRDFLIKQLNQWQHTGAEKWLAPERWAACATPFSRESTPSRQPTIHAKWCWERLQGLRVWGGLDFALTTDTNALAFVADDPDDPDGERVLVAWMFWLPGDDLAERCNRDNIPYDLFAREGWLRLTPGDVADINQIEADVLELIETYELDVAQVGYDRAYDQGAGVRLANDHGVPMAIAPQRYSFFTKPIVTTEKLVLQGKFDHGGNPLATRQALACTLQEGGVGGKMLAKGKSKDKKGRVRIDGMVAAVQAMGVREIEREEGGTTPGLYVG